MALAKRVVFDPRAEYAYKPERRFPLAYFANWTDDFFPADALRRYALQVFQHFERARAEGVVRYFGLNYEEAGGHAAICDSLIGRARSLQPTAAWDQLRRVRNALPRTPADDVAKFLERAKSTETWEMAFSKRLPWFAYLGTASLEECVERQAFFYAYANLWTTTNAYVRAGAQSFASVLQNTMTAIGLDYPCLWRAGERPTHTRFPTLARADDEVKDRSDYSPVAEVFGFLNLHREPLYNGFAEPYREWLGDTGAREDDSAYELTHRLAQRTSAWLVEHPRAIPKLVELLDGHLAEPLQTRVRFENLARTRAHKAAQPELGDERWRAELDDHARADLRALSDRERAAVALHLLLDSEVSLLAMGEAPAGATPHIAIGSQPAPSNSNASQPELRRLPPALRAPADRALAYLHANLHVMFAGPPGTGKTLLAQFVGHAWNQRLLAVPETLAGVDAPLTTVGNSAWSPLHTIGGMVPLAAGGFITRPGVLVQPATYASKLWRLRNEAIVIDELNRADLDRCIGELYPLLSGSVARVVPAGLPEVDAIEVSERFRLIATVNDSALDASLFPISEGLTRRFQRIELPGASREDIAAYIGYGAGSSPRQDAAREAIDALFNVAREADELSMDDDDERLPFGAAYFALLAAWAQGSLRFKLLGKDASESEEAADLLLSGLRILARRPRWDEILRKLAAIGGRRS
jgi:hypothetical protein